jgi:hypothetical protein
LPIATTFPYIEQLFHPPSSPDVNLIEPLWHTLKELICAHEHIPTNLDELKVAIWELISVEDIDKHAKIWLSGYWEF